MYCRATSMIVAGISAMALSAQTPPQRFPGVPQFSVTPHAPVVSPATDRALRQLLQSYSPEKTGVCSIPLLELAVAKNVEQIPTVRPRAESIDHMPTVKLPAPPCNEEKR
jgi:hypothetical protein